MGAKIKPGLSREEVHREIANVKVSVTKGRAWKWAKNWAKCVLWNQSQFFQPGM